MRSKTKKIIRSFVLGALKIFNPGLISIKHPFTGKKFFLDAYLHKGYWYRGKNADKKAMLLFSKLIEEGNVVIEVGAHIGFMTTYYSMLTGVNGKVYAFEPGINNLPYLVKNIAPYNNIELIKEAVAAKDGVAVFYMESYTGQNNSLAADHTGIYSHKNIVDQKRKFTSEVKTTSLDNFSNKMLLQNVDFIKVDIESAEYNALLGMQQLLALFKPAFMFEVTRNHKEIFEIFAALDYMLFNEKKQVLSSINLSGNIYGIHKQNQHLIHKVFKENLQ
ncbi:hypothetical protein BH11BAC6_BH11BAC6_12680 [soil metagenome]